MSSTATYSPDEKRRFLKAAQVVRSGGGSWTKAFQAARAKGYKGGAGALATMLGSRGDKRYKPRAPENVDGAIVEIFRSVIGRRRKRAKR